MKVRARAVDLTRVPANIAQVAKPGQTFITTEACYEVFAVASFDGLCMLQIVDDLSYPAWLPAWLFEVIDPTPPHDWICNLFQDEPALLLGPEFIAKDQAAYTSMVELEADQVDRFWGRLESLRAAEVGNES